MYIKHILEDYIKNKGSTIYIDFLRVGKRLGKYIIHILEGYIKNNGSILYIDFLRTS